MGDGERLGPTGGKRCRRPGCRNWAMRGRAYCWPHRADEGSEGRGEERVGEQDTGTGLGAGSSVETRHLFVRRVDAALSRLESTMAGPESLADEIGALRLVLARLLVAEEDPARLASSIPRIVDATVRAMRAQRTLSGALAESVTEALTQLLIELGLDAPS